MEKQDAFFLGKDTLFYAKPIRLASCYTALFGEPNSFSTRSPFGDRSLEIHTNNKCNSYDFIQADNSGQQAGSATELDTQQNQAKSNY